MLLQASPEQFQPETIGAGSKLTPTGGAALLSPVVQRLDFQSKQPEQTLAQLQALQSSMKHLTPPTPKGVDISSTGTPPIGQSAMQPGLESLTDFSVFTNKTVQVPSVPKSLVGEPSVAQKNEIIFFTGNWYAARSSNNGQNWTYRDPFGDMQDFCCDQDTMYNPSRGIFLWYRMGKPLANGTNRFRLGVSADASVWAFYDVHPSIINPLWTNQIFDFVIMAYSDNYLYITNNMFQNQTYTNSLILRMPLDSLRSHSALTPGIYFANNGGFAPVQEARQIMYFATHVSTTVLRLYVWPESSLTISSTSDIIHSIFKSTNVGDATCPAPDGGDICRRLDDRILGGWVAKGVIGFFWNVAQDGIIHVRPYTYIIRLDETTKILIDEPTLSNPNYAWVYPWVSPNARGDLGLVAFTSGPARYPRMDIGIQDASTGNTTWQFYPGGVATSTNGPESSCVNGKSNPCWGDFIRVRPYSCVGDAWIASGYTLEGNRTGQFVQPRYVVFGRAADNPYNRACVSFYLLPSAGGSITFNGTSYANGQNAMYNATRIYMAIANVPQNYTFSQWNITGNITIANPQLNPTNVTVTATGDLTAILIPPNVTINFRTNPSNGGTITCSGQTFSNGQTGKLPANSSIICTAHPPKGLHLSSWAGLASGIIPSGSATTVSVFSGNGGILTANFASGSSVGLPPFSMLATSILAVAILWASRRRRLLHPL